MEVEKLKLTENKVNKIRLKNSLVERAIEKIVRHIDYFVNTKDAKKTLMNLDDNLREKILQNLTKSYCPEPDREEMIKVLLEAVSLLISPKTTEICLDGILSFSPLNLKEKNYLAVLKMLFCQAPNLETLVINEAIFGYENFLLDLRICNTIAILSNLKKLHLNYQIISYADLKALCKQLKKLEYVDVNVDLYTQFNDQDEAEIEDSKICFSNLRVFIFDDNFPRRNSIDILERFAQFCFEHLPKLEVIQNFADNYSIQDFELDGNASLRVSSERPALRHLSTVPTDVQNLHLIYPNVTHLKITTAGDFHDLKNRIKGVLQFSKVESLTLMQIDSEEIIYEILDAYGQNLRSLKIGIPNDRFLRLEFKCIFSRCPKLESLFLDSVSLLDDLNEITGFDELTEFVWNIQSYWSVYLKNILSAPKLKKLSLIGISNYDCKDLSQVSELIENGSILGQLEQFQIITNPMETKQSAYDSCLVLPPLRNLIFNASAFLPKLSSVDGVFNFVVTEWDAVVSEKYKNDSAYLSALKFMQERKAFKSFDPFLTRLLETFNNKMLIFVFK